MHVDHFRAYPITRSIDVRMAVAAIQQAELFPGLSSLQRSNVGTIISELGTNILKYAHSGRILLRAIRCGQHQGIEVLAIDDGPGIANISQAMQDHFTTGRTLGLGLGAVQRLASEFQLRCPPEGGTHARAVCWINADPAAADERQQACPGELHWHSVMRNRPALGERLSGDCLLVLDHGSLSIRVLIDGTGHGPIAHQIAGEAAGAIEQAFHELLGEPPSNAQQISTRSTSELDALLLSVLHSSHGRMRGSRGAAVGIAASDRRRPELHFLGVGNTRILHLGYKGWEGVSRDGQLGVSFRTPTVQHYPIQPGDVVLQASDGLRTSSLRAMRAQRPGASQNLEQIADHLLARASYNDDVSLLLSQCRI